MKTRSGLKKIKKSTRKGLRSYWVKSDATYRKPTRDLRPKIKKAKMMVSAWKNHAALNLGQGVRDAKNFASDIAYHVKNLSSDAYYGAVTPWGLGSHTHKQVRELSRGSFAEWYRKGRNG